jgi:hypothetical protein
MSGTTYHVPGVYYEPRPRVSETPLIRTDIAGFVGFDPRVRNGSSPSMLTGFPPAGHAFRIDVSSFQVVVRGVSAMVPASIDLVLSESAFTIPIAAGESIVYGLAAAERSGAIVLATAAGAPALSGGEIAPTDAVVDAAVAFALGVPLTAPHPWIRLADIAVRRDAGAVFVTARFTAERTIVCCSDYRDYVLAFGAPVDDGTLLAPAVRTFFANGGRRCWVATLVRPDFEDQAGLARSLEEMVGEAGSSELEATGLERLLLLPDVTIVDVPDLYALRVDRRTRTLPIPPSEREACFLPCDTMPSKGTATTTNRLPAWTPIFESAPPFDGTAPPNDVFMAQVRLLTRCIAERWRVLLLLSVPRLPDGGSGPYVAPTHQDAAAWRRQFDVCVKQSVPNAPSIGDTDEMSCVALYWPWVYAQEHVDDPVIELPPSPYAAGVIARRDLARGPQSSPANETLRDVVASVLPFDDEIHGSLYDPDPDAAGPVPAVNVMRAFPGYGIQLWGARTLSTERWLRFLSVRRTLTAIELRMKAALDLLVFEPNIPALWLQITQTALAVLTPFFESGALRGDRPEEAFYVRCDGRVNPPEAVERGELLVEVGVAVAAPAEFIVFRVGRREGVIEVVE